MLLEIPEQDLASVIGCLTLGTLYALRSRAVPSGTGEVLSWRIKQALRGKVPPLLVDVLNGMDEIKVLERAASERHWAEGIDEAIHQTEWILREQAHINYDLGWVPNPEAPGPGVMSRRARNEEMPYPDPVDDTQVLRALARGLRSGEGDGQQGWASFDDVLNGLGRADAVQAWEWFERLLLLEWVEEAPEGGKWRPTRLGWDHYEEHERVSRPGLWDQDGVEE
jgi:hypothetical protein